MYTVRLQNTKPESKFSLNIADKYWAREQDPNYKKACEEWENMVETRKENPALVSLYKFASKYHKNWAHAKEVKVPHITPNFNMIPNKKGKTERGCTAT